ncbi:hypothetical protein HPP92_026014 [Vanilla planifolia]|uniref:Uncharacterized protein n=1 Tax=Vanilla planifolia TaxID=51239 RepID=A0A835PDJ0_VANPL|nr:hypothetical protein HPP92_026290 [Vanilla planifolia]KAG0451839.1 hypothetical protein HPP92_026014 [Vanilla planifolia]
MVFRTGTLEHPYLRVAKVYLGTSVVSTKRQLRLARQEDGGRGTYVFLDQIRFFNQTPWIVVTHEMLSRANSGHKMKGFGA